MNSKNLINESTRQNLVNTDVIGEQTRKSIFAEDADTQQAQANPHDIDEELSDAGDTENLSVAGEDELLRGEDLIGESDKEAARSPIPARLPLQEQAGKF